MYWPHVIFFQDPAVLWSQPILVGHLEAMARISLIVMSFLRFLISLIRCPKILYVGPFRNELIFKLWHVCSDCPPH